ncbi:TadE-like protein [Nitrobacter hamburgensis X14]|uniref:TadE-like protein n=1 Tax=Nitrobacter hamburgensis (strain DSM 10229 / NCIMB 13809 / X14) TaxID=323097 RepID=Q1QR60_NITHX|nr:TadE/TadG family type IV pilus assembly protein [Nitrobacter hamburgensis]ABE61287.1 TadE-like protein [Nitrobacter hamburgensis X14]
MSPFPRFRTVAARVAGRFRGNQRGSAAVEFALVAPLFFALLFAIIETGMVFFASQSLETTLQDSARMIQTGQAQIAKYDKASFKKDVVCANASVLFDCENGIFVDVHSYPSGFGSVEIDDSITADPITGDRNFVDNTQYSAGGPGDIVVVRLFYQWPLFVTGLGYNLANLSGSKRLLAATVAFKNEPYS